MLTADKLEKIIALLSSKASASQKIEQQNRELHSRSSENMKEEVTTMKLRVKGLQVDLAKEHLIDQIVGFPGLSRRVIRSFGKWQTLTP